MEDVMQAPQVAATPQDVSQPQVAQQDVQPQQVDGLPVENAETGGQDQLTQEQQWIELETGAKYRSLEDLKRGAEEKDRFIRQLIEERRQAPQPQAQVPEANPQQAVNEAIAALQSEIEQDYRNDPKYRDYSPEAIAEQAYIDAKNAYRVEQRLARQYQQQMQQTQWKQFVDSTPELNTPLAQEVYQRAEAEGMRFPNPKAHLDAVHLEMFRRGIMPQSQPQAGNMAVQGALQNQQRPIFGNLNSTGQAPAAVPSHVASSLAEAQKRGVTDPTELERIRGIAMNMNVNRFNKNRGFNQ